MKSQTYPICIICISKSHYLQEDIEGAFHQFVQQNEESSWQKCQDLLDKLGFNINTKLTDGVYFKSGGFTEFQEDVANVQIRYQEYQQHTHLGVKVCTCNQV